MGSKDEDGEPIYEVKYEYGDPLYSENFDRHAEESEDRILKTDKHGDLPHYKPLFYSKYGNATELGVSPRASFNMTETMNFTIQIKEKSSTHEVSADSLPLYKTKYVALKNAQQCSRLHGYYDQSIR